ncbi:hypothetical protein HMPREF0063_11044 [Aeromicrobium marinum DSM 15272]|uniref:Cell division protein SepF n=2 Tax=Aeromicrobium marinum TaxID=219314 RepID=E2S958_9ACTN|nr:hypothetical protein HMPREF0063_11044 [Aeromicrobium marinum DSM 15272]
MRKMGEYLGLVEQADYDEILDDEPAPAAREQRTPSVVRPATVASIDERRRPAPRTAGRDLSRIETVTPRTYNDARAVGENFRAGVPVIMNLSEIEVDDAKRLVDFAAGLVFAVHGSITRVTDKVFLLSPENVLVSDEDKQRIAGGSFYDQN